MPTYEYECTKCGYQFEEFQGITEAPLKECPKCKGKLRRLITGGAGVIFKGSGFYVTDYKKANITEHKEQKKDLKKTEPPPPAKDKDTKPDGKFKKESS